MTSEPRPDEPGRASRWKRLEALYQEACADDEAMRRNVESLLEESDSEDGFLATPPLALPPYVMADLVSATMIGTSLGGYHLVALLGAGGMGEVYRARDAKLGREVAIKILPSAFTSHPERLARFEREARMLAAVNHPNICAIYGVDEADGVRFLILELVEEIDSTDDAPPGAVATPARVSGLRRRDVWLPWAALATFALAVGTWEARRAATVPASGVPDHPLANATFSRVTNWEGRKSTPTSRPTAGSSRSWPTRPDSSTSG